MFTHKNLLSFLLVLVALLVFARVAGAGNPRQSGAAPPILLTDSSLAYPAEGHVDILIDSTGTLTLSEVSSQALANRFVPGQDDTVSSIVEPSAVWVRLRVRNESDRVDWLFRFADSRVSYVNFYRGPEATADFQSVHTGNFLPFTTREIPDRTFIFNLPIAQGTEQTLYLRLASGFPINLPITILSPGVMAEQTRSDFMAFGLFYGAMLIMAGYNFFVFLSLRDRAYLYLALVILGFAASKAAQDGVGHEFLWPQFPNRWTGEYTILLTMLAVSYFTTRFLDLDTRAPATNRFFNLWRILVVGVAFAVPLFNTLFVIAVLMGVLLVLILLAAWRAYGSGYRPALLFLASWLLPLAATVIFIAYAVGVLPFPYFADRLILFFLAALALFWSFVLADRINSMRMEMEIANRNLAQSEKQYHSLFQDSLDSVFIITREGKIIDLNPAGMDLFGYQKSELDRMNVRDLFATEKDYTLLQQTLDQQGSVADYETNLKSAKAGVITAIISSTLWHDPERGLSGYQGIMRDVTERRRTQQELATYRLHLEELVAARTTQANAELAERRRAEHALEQRVRELSTLNEIAKTISLVQDLAPALERVTESVTRLLGINAAIIGEVDPTDRSFRILAGYPTLTAVGAGGHTLTWDSAPVLARVLDAQAPVVVYEAADPGIMGQAAELFRNFDGQSTMWVPLRVGGSLNGLMVLSTSKWEQFVQQDLVNLVETVGSEIATALENARLYQQAQASAIADERQRLARELHDSVTQLLYSIVLLAGGWALEAEQNRHERVAPGKFNELAELGQQALGEMRLLLYQLRSPMLTDVGLEGALQQRLNAVEQRVGIQTEIHVSGDIEALPLHMQQELYLIAREALNNALRHARATWVQVELEKLNHHMVLAVRDNGTGFEQQNRSEGMGLRNMYARAQALGAKLEIQSEPGRGTDVLLHIDLNESVTG